jgi:cephalosporin-C deacetylase-like acetyl esterase
MSPLPLLLAAAVVHADTLADTLRGLDPTVLATDAEKAKVLQGMLSRDVRSRMDAANRRDAELWSAIKTKADWERFRDQHIDALRSSLGVYPAPPKSPKVKVVRTLEGEDYQIDDILYESRPGLWVSANVYRPTRPVKSMPGFVIIHSHHNPKSQSELQDMGVTWARQNCFVLVLDQLGHGERRQHPFVDEKSFPKSFRPGRQDYYFRYNLGMQLSLIGDSLIGWMAWDISRGLDVLLAEPGVDRTRIALLGSVAAGGDAAAVTAALDPRFTVVAPFNFGGPQPETTYPLPADRTFNYAGGGSWESTRNLRLSASEHFMPWLIVGAAAPRSLIYAHEFAWDREHDPVWARLQKIYGLYDAADRLDFTHGRGSVKGTAGPENTHCNNIGPEHRKLMYPALKRWFDLPVPEAEARERRPASDLLCWTPDLLKELKPRSVDDLAQGLADERLAAARRRRADLTPEKRSAQLAQNWAALLGEVRPSGKPKATDVEKENRDGVRIERFVLTVERDIRVPALLLVPKAEKPPVVVGLAQDGKRRFLNDRSATIAELLRRGVAVCLPDVRGTGETRPGNGRDRSSSATALSASEQMLGGTLLGRRLADLSALLDYLGGRADLDGKRIALWGESFAPVNAPNDQLAAPLDVDQPAMAEPLGPMLALFGALYHDQVKVVAARGGLVSFRSLLRSPFVHVPHDVVVPGALRVSDLDDVAAALAPRALLVEGPVDGLNLRASPEVVSRSLEAARAAYGKGTSSGSLSASVEMSAEDKLAEWLAKQLRR